MLWPNFFRPSGADRVLSPTHGLRRGLGSFALSGLTPERTVLGPAAFELLPTWGAWHRVSLCHG
jgi:hypothetical protein